MGTSARERSASGTGTLPITYEECRARFREAVRRAGADVEATPIAARGPHGLELTIDTASFGEPSAAHVLLVLSGVHGVEGFVASAQQRDLVRRLADDGPPTGCRIVLVHGVNPWGMAWWRRQNESNVDLNRNWARDLLDPPPNESYATVHPLLCPDTDDLPTDDSFLDPMAKLIEDHGIGWVTAAVSTGQYTHADGLYFGGDRSEESTLALADIATRHLAGAQFVVTVDLHTGHGAYASATLLSHAPAGSPGDRWARDTFDDDIVETVTGNPAATTPEKVGQLALGLADVAPEAVHRSVTLEIGTVSNTTMILAERAEHWVHRHGDRDDPRHAAAVRHHRTCSTPDDSRWEAAALDHGRVVLDAALRSVARGPAD